MVYRVYAEKKEGLAPEASKLLNDCNSFLGIKNLKKVRVLNRYDAEEISPELFEYAKTTVFSEPQIDNIYDSFDVSEADRAFAVEPLPGQFDQRSDSAAQCIQLISMGARPVIKASRIYLLYGDLTDEDVNRIKKYVINPVESREASFDLPETLAQEYAEPTTVETVTGFITADDAGLAALLDKLGLAMDLDDLKFLRDYFRDDEKRDPTITEIRVVDTYWSDHCRHTTFSTHIDSVDIADERVKASYERYLKLREEVYGTEKAAVRPRTLMDAATIGAKVLKKRGLLPEIDVSEEINACSINYPIEVDGKTEDWLLMFKNETHNHPTEIEPFGGAATCIGGCIRDPLSGRAYVHQAMRLTGAGDPRVPADQTLAGKLPQRQLVQTAAAGYSSYGNQIGLATGHVAEVYHKGYIAKRLECGVVVGAAPKENVVRLEPVPGDVIILLGGRTGRDGIGGATGSSKSHNEKSLVTMASEVQKGNAPEERKIQRLFRNKDVTTLIKRCNDFGAGGVSVAIGELAPGLSIDLDAVRKKYEGLDGTEIAISESQERMAVVVAPEDEAAFIAAAEAENLEAYRAAIVTESPRMVMTWKGNVIADLSRAFLDTNGAVKHTAASIPAYKDQAGEQLFTSLKEMAGDLRTGSRRGLVERFDSTIGAGTVLMPYGGKNQRTPEQSMAALMPVLPDKKTDAASLMSWGLDPDRMTEDPYMGAYEAVYTSVAKIVASGADYKKAYLTFQEFFERLKDEPERWGKPLAALLGSIDAQMELEAAAIGGKDSMSGTFMDINVPPTLISFAIAPVKAGEVITGDFKEAGHPVYLFRGDEGAKVFAEVGRLAKAGSIKAARAVEYGIAEAVMKMSFGNDIGFKAAGTDAGFYQRMPGAIVAELDGEYDGQYASLIGYTDAEPAVTVGGETESIEELYKINEAVLTDVYSVEAAQAETKVPKFEHKSGQLLVPSIKTAVPKVVIPVFPGTNCEYDMARAFIEAGADPEIFVVRNLTTEDVAASADRMAGLIGKSNIIAIPGGFSGGDEPEGSAKFITAFFRNPLIKEKVTELLDERDGLMIGICNGFQALIKLGLVPCGKIIDTDSECATLTYNSIGRHQSRMVHTRICSDKSPWLKGVNVGDVFNVPISHGEGRFFAPQELIDKLAAAGQIATQYVDLAGEPTMDTAYNPNGSMSAIEGILSPDGRVLGKMGHSERKGAQLYRNMPGAYDMKLFESAVKYFRH